MITGRHRSSTELGTTSDLAHQRTPLPSSGIAPKDYAAGQNITAIERAAGRTYRGRLIAD